MDKLLRTLVFLIPFIVFSQIPSYYNDVNLNLTGESLKDELTVKIISSHTAFLSYSPDVWNALKQTDIDPNNPSRVLLIYGYNDSDNDIANDRSRDKNTNGGGSTDWNREHVYPKSLGTPNLGTSGPGADAHHLRPSDVGWNSIRGSSKFTDGSGNSGPVGNYWYPGDEWKGDVARMMMYMYLRYGNQCRPTGVGVGPTVSGDPNMITLFLEWNAEDPVSDFELQRNPILETIQGNRNPFIDNPAFATQIWGGPQAEDRFGAPNGSDTTAPSVPEGLAATLIAEDSVDLSWHASTDNVGVTGYRVYIDGVLKNVTSSTQSSVTGLTASTPYSFSVRALDAMGNISGESNILTITTNSSGAPGNGTATDLFISEYVEGSSNNKALEIANFTGSNVNLSTYTLRRNINGGSGWGSSLNLSGSVTNGSVFVIANSSASSSITDVANTVSGGDALIFNGNDPVGLFKNGTLIDIVGIFNSGTSDFAKDITLRRKSEILNPSTNYNTSEWDSHPVDTFNGLGSHSTVSEDGSSNTAPVTVLHEAYFESGWDNWTDGGDDCSRYSGPRSYEGSYSINLRDNSGTGSAMTSELFDLSAYQSVELEFYFYSYSMENGEDFFLQFNNGSGWNTLISYISGTDFLNNGFYTATITLDDYSHGFSSNTQFRFQCNASSNSDYVYIDQVTITGYNGGGVGSKEQHKPLKKVSFLSNRDTTFENLPEDEVIIYPNPVLTDLNIYIKTDEKITYKIYNSMGKLVKSGSLKNRSIDVSILNSGMYILLINGDDGIWSKQFLK